MDTVFASHLDPNRALPGGTYLDDVQRKEAEIQRAKVEDREADLVNPPAVQGTPVIRVEALTVEQAAVAGNLGLLTPSEAPVVEAELPFDEDDED